MQSEKGFTLLEVIIAVTILVIVLGPFLSNLVWHAKTGEDTEKMQMAIKVLQSIKEELMAVRFRDFITFADKYPQGDNKDFILDDMFFPQSREEVLKFQQKYRDFEVTGHFKFVQRKNRDPKERTMLTVFLEVTWVQSRIGKQSKTLSMSIIDPKS